jgi:molecular chaperone DnaJ
MDLDPYVVLEVSREAGPAELKRAYRRLAMRWHPDRNDHPEATERFKQIRAAYDCLLEPEEDEDGYDAPPDEAAKAADEPATVRAADIRLNLDIAIEEAAAGCRKTISYARGRACPTCEGSGEYGIARTRFCGVCHGSGRVHDGRRTLVPCGECSGRGLFTERICPDCGGSGRETANVSLEIRVPPGMLSGDELRLAGQGEPGSDDIAAGDLYLTLVIRSHPLFKLRGRDVHFSMPVSALSLLVGGEIAVPGLAGRISLMLEGGAVERREVRLPGKGYPGRGKSVAGDLVLELLPVFPGKLNARQRKLLLQANAALLDDAESALPEIVAWRKANGLH